jgi:hypothetical protein
MSRTFRAVLRAAGPVDVPHLVATYQNASSLLPPAEAANLLPRPFDEVRRAAEEGLFFLIEDASGAFIAGAGVFDLSDPSLKELGMAYVTPNWQGFGIQKLLLQVRVCGATLAQVPDAQMPGTDYAKLLTAIKPSNLPSLTNAKKSGFEPLPPPIHPALLEPCELCANPKGPGRICCCDYYHLTHRARAKQIRESLLSQPWQSQRRTDLDTLQIDLKVRYLTDPAYRDALGGIVQHLESLT